MKALGEIRKPSILQQIIDDYPDEQFLKADGFDDCIIGVEEKTMRLVYSCDKCIDSLVNHGMSYEEAQEYFSFNVSGAYVGELTPIWMESYPKDYFDAENCEETENTESHDESPE